MRHLWNSTMHRSCLTEIITSARYPSRKIKFQRARKSQPRARSLSMTPGTSAVARCWVGAPVTSLASNKGTSRLKRSKEKRSSGTTTSSRCWASCQSSNFTTIDSPTQHPKWKTTFLWWATPPPDSTLESASDWRRQWKNADKQGWSWSGKCRLRDRRRRTTKRW